MTKNTAQNMKKVISLQDLQPILYGVPPKPRIDPDENPSAQSLGLLQNRQSFDNVLRTVEAFLTRNDEAPVFLRAVVELLFLNGLRISEVRKIRGTDITATGHIRIRSSKGSWSRMAVTGIYKSYWMRQKGRATALFIDYSRFWFYRQFKRYGIVLSHGAGFNDSVTHAFRHILLKAASAENIETETLQKYIGHKSIKSTKTYTNDKKQYKKS